MTEPQRNPNYRREPDRVRGPSCYMLQKRPSMSRGFVDVRSVPPEYLEAWREHVDKANQELPYKKWRIVTR